MDTAIRGGLVVTGSTRFTTDIGIRDGRIAQLGGSMVADRDIDARGRLVIPGGIDPHVHLELPAPAGGSPVRVDNMRTGTRAAAAGGITTVGNMVYPTSGETPTATIARAIAASSSEAMIDFMLHPVVVDPAPEVIDDLPALVAAGHPSIKIFTVSEHFESRIADYVALLAAARQAGVLTMVHCEDGPIVRYLTQDLLRRGNRAASHYPEARPPYAEAIAVARMAALSEATDAPVYVTHVASRDALDVATAARGRGVRVHVETRPIYLFFTSDRFVGADGPLFVGNPPLRESRDVAALWANLMAGSIDTVASDHAPWSRAQKLEPGHDIGNFRPGMADLETMLPILFSEGVLKGRISLERFIEVTSINAAKLFGLYPSKGAIRVGSDADLVVWDADLVRTVRAAEGQSAADFSLYEGWRVTGWPTITMSRGEIVASSGEIVATQPSGRSANRRAFPDTAALAARR